MGKQAPEPIMPARTIKNPRPRPARMIVRMVADTTEGVAEIADYESPDRPLSELFDNLKATIQMGFVRSIHIYLPGEDE